MRSSKRKGKNKDSGGPSKKKSKWKDIDLSIPTRGKRWKKKKGKEACNKSKSLESHLTDRKRKLALFSKNYRRKGIDEDSDTFNKPRTERIRTALQGLLDGTYKTISEAASTNGVHYDQIQRRATGKVKWYRRNGPEPYLTLGEERHLSRWVVTMRNGGFPVTPKQLKDTVQDMISKEGRKTPFTKGRPSNGWYTGFLNRHPEIKLEPTNLLDKARAKVTTEAVDDRSEARKELLDLQRKGIECSLHTDESEECICPICGRKYEENVVVGWVGCDSCNQWYHISCMPAKIVTAKMLRKKKWFCSSCK